MGIPLSLINCYIKSLSRIQASQPQKTEEAQKDRSVKDQPKNNLQEGSKSPVRYFPHGSSNIYWSPVKKAARMLKEPERPPQSQMEKLSRHFTMFEKAEQEQEKKEARGHLKRAKKLFKNGKYNAALGALDNINSKPTVGMKLLMAQCWTELAFKTKGEEAKLYKKAAKKVLDDLMMHSVLGSSRPDKLSKKQDSIIYSCFIRLRDLKLENPSEPAQKNASLYGEKSLAQHSRKVGKGNKKATKARKPYKNKRMDRPFGSLEGLMEANRRKAGTYYYFGGGKSAVCTLLPQNHFKILNTPFGSVQGLKRAITYSNEIAGIRNPSESTKYYYFPQSGKVQTIGVYGPDQQNYTRLAQVF